MVPKRDALPAGTRLRLESGSVFEITGAPIGQGGGSLIYPARRLVGKEDRLQSDGLDYALKECYPLSTDYPFLRTPQGEIVPKLDSMDAREFLQRAQKRQLAEAEVSLDIFKTADRVLPLRESSPNVTITLPGGEPHAAANTVMVMDSLARKGRSLTACMEERRRFTALETCRILQQVLFALLEVHRAGYLHLDIQAGNIFLRGTLEEGSEIVTLMDFGSARAAKNGRTAPIEDRVIFSSDGYKAPEIRRRNDGKLCLGPEADLYSLGCLALYLLTGEEAEQSRLEANRDGRFLRGNALKRTKCPAHLEPVLQDLLAKLLRQDPDARCGDAGEILTDVSKLIDGLQPPRTALSDAKYDAFICYKHGPIDSPAALTLQRALETYRAPKNASNHPELRGRRPFRRVFVDEGELSSCADMGLQIREALKNSRYLIVLCSGDTPSSPWVEKEIAEFLDLHQQDQSRILTVLTGGDEKRSFPEKLKGRELQGPLAADARGKDLREVKGKLRGDALLKVAAPMLRTDFDTLKQRHKVYRLQRLSAITGGFLLAAAAFGAYAANRAQVIADQAERIQEEYRNSLINESLFLSEQARKRLQDNDPLGAMELALAALPSQQQDRPVLPEAEHVLGEALGAYKTPLAVEDTAVVTGLIQPENKNFFVDDSGENLFTWGSYSGLQVWDTGTMTQKWEFFREGSIYDASQKLLLPEGQRLIVELYEEIVCVDYQNGEILWSVPQESLIDIGLSEDRTELVVFACEGDYFDDAADRKIHVQTLSAQTGQLLREFRFTLKAGLYFGAELRLSPDGKWAAVTVADITKKENQQAYYQYYDWLDLYLLDLESGIWKRLLVSDTQITELGFFEGRLVVQRHSGYSFENTHQNTTYVFANPITEHVEVYDPDTGLRYWSYTYDYYLQDDGGESIHLVSYNDGTDEGKALLVTGYNQCLLLDWETGTLVRSYEQHTGIIDLRVLDNSADMILADGSWAEIEFDSQTILRMPYLQEGITAICRGNGAAYVQSSPDYHPDYTIRKYEAEQYDTSYEKLLELDSSDWYFDRQAGDAVLLSDENQVCLVDTASGEVLMREAPEEYGYSRYDQLGLSADGSKLYWTRSNYEDPSLWLNYREFWEMDLATGAVRQLPQPEKPEMESFAWEPIFREGTLWIPLYLHGGRNGNMFVLYAWELLEGTLTEHYRCELNGSELCNGNSFYWDEDTDRLCFAMYTGYEEITRLCWVEPGTGRTGQIILESPPEASAEEYVQWQGDCFRWSPSGTRAVFGYGDQLLVMDEKRGQLWTLSAEEEVIAAWFSPDESTLLLFHQDHVLSQHRISDGSELGRIDLKEFDDSLTTLFADDQRSVWLDSGTLGIFLNSGCIVLGVTEESMGVSAYLEKCVGYDRQEDRFIIVESDYTSGGTIIGSFRRYSVEDLVAKANAILYGQ